MYQPLATGSLAKSNHLQPCPTLSEALIAFSSYREMKARHYKMCVDHTYHSLAVGPWSSQSMSVHPLFNLEWNNQENRENDSHRCMSTRVSYNCAKLWTSPQLRVLNPKVCIYNPQSNLEWDKQSGKQIRVIDVCVLMICTSPWLQVLSHPKVCTYNPSNLEWSLDSI